MADQLRQTRVDSDHVLLTWRDRSSNEDGFEIERSLDRMLKIVERMKLLDGAVPSRSTLHRVLQGAGVSGRPKPPRCCEAPTS